MTTPAALLLATTLVFGTAALFDVLRWAWRIATRPPVEPVVEASFSVGQWAVLGRLLRVPAILFCAFFAVAFIHEQRTAAPQVATLDVNRGLTP